MAADFQLQPKLDALRGEHSARVVAAVDTVLAAAVDARASDVHFEPSPATLTIRFRVDGVLLPAATLPGEFSANVIARLKVMAELLTYRLDIPQEGSVRGDAVHPDLRVSTFPTVHGEKAVVRLFNANHQLTTLASLGFSADHLASLDRILAERNGAILLTGPSGSGKTTTAYACLRHLLQNQPGRNLVTIEDPVEIPLNGVNQSQVRPGSEFDFARGLRSLLRQDPDVILVGEIRDRDTAAIASEAALTGHLVLSTLHAGSACGALSRLLDMGVEPYLLTSGLRAIVNQRLLRQQCSECTGRGCKKCSQTGFRGRFLIAEYLEPDTTLRRAILERADRDGLETAASNRRTISDAAQAAVADGRTTAEEVARVLGSL